MGNKCINYVIYPSRQPFKIDSPYLFNVSIALDNSSTTTATTPAPANLKFLNCLMSSELVCKRAFDQNQPKEKTQSLVDGARDLESIAISLLV